MRRLSVVFFLAMVLQVLAQGEDIKPLTIEMPTRIIFSSADQIQVPPVLQSLPSQTLGCKVGDDRLAFWEGYTATVREVCISITGNVEQHIVANASNAVRQILPRGNGLAFYTTAGRLTFIGGPPAPDRTWRIFGNSFIISLRDNIVEIQSPLEDNEDRRVSVMLFSNGKIDATRIPVLESERVKSGCVVFAEDGQSRFDYCLDPRFLLVWSATKDTAGVADYGHAKPFFSQENPVGVVFFEGSLWVLLGNKYPSGPGQTKLGSLVRLARDWDGTPHPDKRISDLNIIPDTLESSLAATKRSLYFFVSALVNGQEAAVLKRYDPGTKKLDSILIVPAGFITALTALPNS